MLTRAKRRRYTPLAFMLSKILERVPITGLPFHRAFAPAIHSGTFRQTAQELFAPFLK